MATVNGHRAPDIVLTTMAKLAITDSCAAAT